MATYTDPATAVLVGPLLEEVLAALSVKSDRLRNTNADAACLRWFRQQDAAFKGGLNTKIMKFRSLINTTTFTIGFTPLTARIQNQNASAIQELAAMGQPLPDPGHGRSHVELDVHFSSLSRYLPLTPAPGVIVATAFNQSQFETLVHELSHLFLRTNDLGYGTENACNLAINNAPHAQNNAENWGIFVEACGHHRTS